MHRRAYSLLHVKSVDSTRRLISGIATTPTPDRLGDVVEPLGVQYKTPLPLLLYHDTTKPVGVVRFSAPTKDGVAFEASLPAIDEPGVLKDRIDEAWQSVKARLVTGVSIGFRVLDNAIERIEKTGGLRFLKTEVLELSLVTVPANADATILAIRSLDVGPAAPGEPEAVGIHLSGVSEPASRRAPKDAPLMQNVSDQLSAVRADLKVKSAQLTDLVSKDATDDATRDEREMLTRDLKELSAKADQLEALEQAQAHLAQPIVKAAVATPSALPRVEVKAPPLPPGIEFARYAISLMAARGNPAAAIDIAKARFPDHPRIQWLLKAAVAGGTTTDATWAAPLVDAQTLTSEFIEFLRPMTVLGKFGSGNVPSLRRVPFNIRIVGQTSGGAGYWVGQAAQKPLTKYDYTAVTLTWAKVAAISVISEELARFSSPSAETLVRDALAGSLIERLDIDFVDPGKAAVANISPASITNGLVALPSSGTTIDAVLADVNTLFQTFIAANINPTAGVFIMSQTTALALSLMQNALGQPAFPGVTMTGGTFFGLPVITSQYAAIGSPASNLVILANASDIFLADDGGFSIDASREASLEMSDDPAGDSGTSGLVSMYQTNQIALRCERYINWALRRAAAVAYMDNVGWGTGS